MVKPGDGENSPFLKKLLSYWPFPEIGLPTSPTEDPLGRPVR